MLRYKTKTSPGLVTLYDIRPGNGVGPFLQPGARTGRVDLYNGGFCIVAVQTNGQDLSLTGCHSSNDLLLTCIDTG